jgi:hypothetical protein
LKQSNTNQLRDALQIKASIEQLEQRSRAIESAMAASADAPVYRYEALDSIDSNASKATSTMYKVLEMLRVNDNDTYMLFDAT